MAEPLGQITLNEGKDNEEFVVPVLVIDKVQNRQSYGYDLYSKTNELKERVGYKTGLVSLSDGSSIISDTIVGVSVVKRKEINDYVALVNKEVK
jgi:hypothetical protein